MLIYKYLVALSVLVVPIMGGDLPEYYCHDQKKDRYEFADPGDKSECKEKDGKFGTFSRQARKYFCRFSDSGVYYGKSHSRKQAEKLCKELGGTLK